MNGVGFIAIVGALMTSAGPPAQPVDRSEGVAQARFERQIAALPPSIQELSAAIRGLTARQMDQLISKRMGKPTRDIGSGLSIPVWDLAGGQLRYSRGIANVTFTPKGGGTVLLVRTRTPALRIIVGEDGYREMFTQREDGMSAWIGVVFLKPNGAYQFGDSGMNPEYRGGQKHNFFMLHPRGRYRITYANGVGPNTQLEALAAKCEIAKLVLRPSGKGKPVTYRIVCDPGARSVSYVGPPGTPFRIDWGF